MSGQPGKRAKDQGRSKGLVPLKEVRKRLMLLHEEYKGIEAIPVAAIIGSADRSAQFTRKFKPRIREQSQRMRQVALAYPEGDFPPIKVYRVDDIYFVRDGHIRVAAAKEMGVAFIDAEITELETDASVPPDVEIIDLIHIEQQRLLLADTDLADVEPAPDLRVSRPAGYTKLRESISSHGYRLIQEGGELLSRGAAARDWYYRIYLPTIEAIKDAELMSAFPHSTEADLFLWLERRRWAMLPHQRTVSLEDAAREAVAGNSSKRSGRLEEEEE